MFATSVRTAPPSTVDAPSVVTVAALAVAVLAPLAPSVLAAQPHDGQRLAHLAVLLGTGVAIGVVPAVRASLLRAWSALPRGVRVASVLVVVLGAASATRAAVPAYAFVEVAVFVLSGALALVVADRVAEAPHRALQSLSRAAVAMVGLYVVLFLVSQVASIAAGTKLWPHAYTGFSNIRHLNQLQSWTYALVLLPALSTESGGWRKASLVLGAFWIALAIGSGGRGTLLALALAGVAAAVLMGPTARRHLGTVARVVAGGIGLHLLLNVLPTLILEQEAYALARPAGDARALVWGLALERFADAPWLGIGPMQLAADAAFVTQGSVAHPHNAVVQLLAEWGGPATALVLGIAGWSAWRWARAARLESVDRRVGTLVLTVALVTAAAHAMVSGVVVMPVSQLWGALVVGTALGWIRSRQRHSLSSPRPSRTAFASVVMLAACAAVVLGAGPDAVQVDERDQAEVRDPTVLALTPRVWRAGALLPIGPSSLPGETGPAPDAPASPR